MWTEEKLNDLLTKPSEALVEDMKKIKGDIMVLGAGGKMGPTLCVLAQNAVRKAELIKKSMPYQEALTRLLQNL